MSATLFSVFASLTLGFMWLWVHSLHCRITKLEKERGTDV